MSAQNEIAINPVVVEIFQFKQKWWTQLACFTAKLPVWPRYKHELRLAVFETQAIKVP